MARAGLTATGLDSPTLRVAAVHGHFFIERWRNVKTQPEIASPLDEADSDALVETKRVAPDVITTSEQGPRSIAGSSPARSANLGRSANRKASALNSPGNTGSSPVRSTNLPPSPSPARAATPLLRFVRLGGVFMGMPVDLRMSPTLLGWCRLVCPPEYEGS